MWAIVATAAMAGLLVGLALGAVITWALMASARDIEDQGRTEVERQSRRDRAARTQPARKAGVLVDARYAFRDNPVRLERMAEPPSFNHEENDR